MPKKHELMLFHLFCLRVPTSPDEVACGDQSSIAGTDDDGIADLIIVTVAEIGLRLDECICVKTTTQTVVLVV